MNAVINSLLSGSFTQSYHEGTYWEDIWGVTYIWGCVIMVGNVIFTGNDNLSFVSTQLHYYNIGHAKYNTSYSKIGNSVSVTKLAFQCFNSKQL